MFSAIWYVVSRVVISASDKWGGSPHKPGSGCP